MRAIWLTKHVPPSEIDVVDIKRPELEPDSVIVQVHAAGVNPSDVRYAGGVVPTTPLPRIPGRDFAGIIVEGPSEVVGLEVFGSGGELGIKRNGTHAEFVSIPMSGFARKPEKLTMEQAAAVGVPYITAYKAVVELGNLKQGETILLLGGSGAVGRAAAQIAKSLGSKVIVTTRSSDPESNWRVYSDTVITVPNENIFDKVMAATDGDGANVVLNAVGADVFDSGFASLAHGGRIVSITAPGEHRVSFDLMSFYKRELHFHGLDTLELTASDCAPVLNRLRAGFDSGAYKIDVAKTLPLERASDAYQLVAKGGAGKIVLTTHD